MCGGVYAGVGMTECGVLCESVCVECLTGFGRVGDYWRVNMVGMIMGRV